MNRHQRRAEAKKNGTKMERGVQDILRKDERGKVIAPYKETTVKTKRKSRAGVEYVVYKTLIVKK